MTRLIPLLAALALVFVPAGSARPPARVQVVEKEFTLTLSRPSLHPGPAIVNVVNLGQDAHDLVLVRRGRSARPARTKLVPPHGTAELEVRLVPGRYDLFCSLPGHRAAGMRAALAVRRS